MKEISKYARINLSEEEYDEEVRIVINNIIHWINIKEKKEGEVIHRLRELFPPKPVEIPKEMQQKEHKEPAHPYS